MPFLAQAQVNFEQGYIVANDGSRVRCLIRNYDWEFNPVRFQYRIDPGSPILEAGIDEVKEFGAEHDFKYVRAEVIVDQSPDDLQRVGTDKNPVWKNEKVFLKVLVEGKANLYYLFTRDGGTRYFYAVRGGEIQQLVYKKFYVSIGQLAVNDTYKQQLYMQVSCGVSDLRLLEGVSYKTKDLIAYFRKYNVCMGAPATNANRVGRDLFRLSVKPGVNAVFLSAEHTYTYVMPKTVFDPRLTLRLGLEGEFILPFNKNKWSVPLELSYQYYKAEALASTSRTMTVQYRALDIAFGLRYHLFLKGGARLYLNGLIIGSRADKLYSTIYYPYRILYIRPAFNYAAGAGVAKGSFSAEVRFHTSKNLVSGYGQWFTDYRVVAFVAGFTFFDAKSRRSVPQQNDGP